MIGALALLTGCAASPSEKAWQAMHLVDVAQTLNGITHGCMREVTITRYIIGEKPSDRQVLTWGVSVAALHYLADRWLTNTTRVSARGKKILRAIDLAYKAVIVGRNHRIGMRPFGDNPGCPD